MKVTRTPAGMLASLTPKSVPSTAGCPVPLPMGLSIAVRSADLERLDTRKNRSVRIRQCVQFVPDAVARSPIAVRLDGDQRDEEHRKDAERGKRGELRRDRQEREEDRGAADTPRVQRLDVAVSEGHVRKEVD